jgi:dynein heavy chain
MIELLKQQEVETDGHDFVAEIDGIVTSLDDLNLQKVLTIKTNILPLQQQETVKLKENIHSFETKVKNFRKEFLEKAPFGYDPNESISSIDNAYNIIDDFF